MCMCIYVSELIFSSFTRHILLKILSLYFSKKKNLLCNNGEEEESSIEITYNSKGNFKFNMFMFCTLETNIINSNNKIKRR